MRKRGSWILLLFLTALLTFVVLAGTKVFAQELPEIYNSGSINGIIFPSLDDSGEVLCNDFMDDGDLVVAYVDEGYLIGKGIWREYFYKGTIGRRSYADTLEGLSMVAYNHEGAEQQSEKRSGAYHREHIFLAVYKNGAFYRFRHQEILAAPLNILYVRDFSLSDQVVEIKQIPYLSWLNSQCPMLEIRQIDAGTVSAGDEVLIGAFKPEYQKGYEYILSEGSGTVFRDGYYTWRYMVGKEDGERGYVSLLVKAIPYEGCNEDQVLFPCKILMQHQGDQAAYPNLTKREWQTLMKYYMEIIREGNTVKACYAKKKPHWPDKPLPAIKMEFLCGTRFKPPRQKDERIVQKPYPCETFTIPEGFDRGYIKVTSLFHGYTWSFKF